MSDRPVEWPARRPAVPAVVAFAAGIAADRFLDVALVTWLAAAVTFLVLAGVAVWGGSARKERQAPRSGRLCALSASLLILAALAAAGGARQHLFWSIRASDDVARFVASPPRPVRMAGVIETSVEIIAVEQGPRIPSWMELDRSTFVLNCERIEDVNGWIPVSGRVRVDVDGHLVHAGVGDRVEILGKFSRPGPPRNPGGFDFQRFLRAQGVDSTVHVSHPTAVMRQETLHSLRWKLARWRESVRKECRTLFVQHLSFSSGVVAASLLLGDRTLMTDELRTRFTESGTMHLLAISGLHVGIMLGMLSLLCRLLNLSAGSTAAVLIAIVILYAVLTNHRPPVLRATVLATLSLIGLAAARKADGVNLLAVTALLLLLWRPADLFDIGAQLSFLAVVAILVVSNSSLIRFSPVTGDGLPPPERPLLVELLTPAGRWLWQGYVITGAIWLATLPLTISTFHLVAPVGYLLNVLLIPFIALVLGLGYLFVISGLLLPPVATPLGWAFNASLESLLNIVGVARSAPLGHFYVPHLSVWWLIGFYLLLGTAWGLWNVEQRAESGEQRTSSLSALCSPRLAGRGLLLWLGLGLAWPTGTARDGSLRCTVLSVGHGLACVLEYPGGETVLYDAGTIGDGRQAERAVEQYLWSRNIGRIDAIVISHADHDHYSGIFGLLEKVPVRTLFVAQSFLDFAQPGVADLCEAASAAGVPIRLVQAGDRLVSLARRAGGVSPPLAEVIHPPAGFSAKDDNAHSVVLDIRFAGRRILLTGDLEKEGLDRVLSLPAEKVDVLLSPHHGGRTANPPRLLDWAEPAIVIVSSGRDDVADQLTEVARIARLLNTRTSGAITIEIRNDGTISVDEFLSPF